MNLVLPKVLSQPLVSEKIEIAFSMTMEVLIKTAELLKSDFVAGMIKDTMFALLKNEERAFPEVPGGVPLPQELKSVVSDEADVSLSTTVQRLCMFPNLAKRVPADVLGLIISQSSSDPYGQSHRDVDYRLACAFGNETMVRALLDSKRHSMQDPAYLLELTIYHGTPDTLKLLLDSSGDSITVNDVSSLLSTAILVQKESRFSKLLLTKLQSMTAAEEDKIAAISDSLERVMTIYTHNTNPIIVQRSWRLLSKGHEDVLKEMVAADPNRFVRDGIGGTLTFLLESTATVTSASPPELGLAEYLVKFMLESSSLRWVEEGECGLGSDVGIGTLPGKLIKEKNERVFKAIWPYVEMYCPKEVDRLRDWATQLDNLEGGAVNGRQQMFYWHDVSEELAHCNLMIYKEKVGSVFQEQYPADEEQCPLRLYSHKYSDYLQSSAVINKGLIGCNDADTIKQLCMLPRLSLKSVDKWISKLLEGCTGPEKRECLLLAAERGNVQMIEVLVSAGVKVEDDSDPMTPYYMAALCGHEAAIKRLVRGGAESQSVGTSDDGTSYTAFGVMLAETTSLSTADFVYRNGLSIDIAHSWLPDKKYYVGLTLDRLIQNVESGIEVRNSEIEMLVNMVRENPAMFFEKGPGTQIRPILKLIRNTDPVLDSLKRKIVNADRIDWGNSYGKQRVTFLARVEQLFRPNASVNRQDSVYLELKAFYKKYTTDSTSNEKRQPESDSVVVRKRVRMAGEINE